MKIHYFLVITILLLNCDLKNDKSNMQESNENIDNQIFTNHATETESILEAPIIETQDDQIAYFTFVDIMEKIYNQDDFYIPLYYRDDYSEPLEQMLKAAQQEVIYEDSEMKRIKINPKVAREVLMVDDLDKLLVFDSEQEIMDTIEMENFEYYENSIEGQYIVSYVSKLPHEKHIVLSYSNYNEESIKKSSKVCKDSTIINAIVQKNGYNIDYFYSFGVMQHEDDTISYLSFFDQSRFLECTYLLKGYQPIDSIINSFVITDLWPVPLATEYELMYVAKNAVPETDHIWTSLIGINLLEEKFVHYPRNRIILQATQ
jgi:hypothetical protein